MITIKQTNQKIPPKEVFRNPIYFCALGFGSGLAPVAPGTFGTLAAIPLYLMIAGLDRWQYIAIVVVMFLLGVWLCQKTSEWLGLHDHVAIVWDEFVGYLITMLWVPASWQWILAGFILFRIFDVLKPWPIRWFDTHIHGGLGIMLDDVLAGIYALAVVQALLWYFGAGYFN